MALCRRFKIHPRPRRTARAATARDQVLTEHHAGLKRAHLRRAESPTAATGRPRRARLRSSIGTPRPEGGRMLDLSKLSKLSDYPSRGARRATGGRPSRWHAVVARVAARARVADELPPSIALAEPVIYAGAPARRARTRDVKIAAARRARSASYPRRNERARARRGDWDASACSRGASSAGNEAGWRSRRRPRTAARTAASAIVPRRRSGEPALDGCALLPWRRAWNVSRLAVHYNLGHDGGPSIWQLSRGRGCLGCS